MIKFTNVDKFYSDGNKSLDNVNLGIKQGEFVFLVGHSGAGKSTLLKLLTREEKISSGRLSVLGEDITKIKASKVHNYRRNLGIVFQDFRLLNEKTVYENVELALRVVGTNAKEIRPRVMEVLKRVGIAEKHSKYPHELSGGESQRVGIARAIVNKPSIIIADECTGNLDIHNSIQILKLLNEINEEGITVIMATHDIEILKLFPKRVIELKEGKIIKDTKREKYEINV
ncbi:MULTISPECIES: cell division ATP-binding protein FtsE [Romboutsia]|uniref:Cell division ATP-binding protein FtsE n=1 Tax=Romboutsia hominis TaxID=1507512 RepID=A0A2P2BPA8_9FIRM|nr:MULTISPECIES: cell division ATP-binding protein FtsE [Romboutsia]MCH1959530.1 cell division ATP-binding protein FtsE [Romboutsia hominis]MCH1970048.1 cell division ATP-binding protein FtsE [Romboutsia hominis]MDB8791191.1 cell division ATP-binding protein FtsE [Romboutsia sp. 1001216sp1]MDB8792302.1 cell division ATP-binding protein FtsE [Romboutsia sp. 1001216sp1]MDB8795597.1 cell division ATP-binding protein FtsE [Romboutsia sp. 1001216sp1]